MENICLSNQLKQFWELEEPKITRRLTREEQECEELFNRTTRYEKDGHFIVTLPIKDNIQDLGNNKDIALKRFYNLERKLQVNPEVKSLYIEFMDTYEKLGHMSRVQSSEITECNNPIYYLPHHPVIKETSTTCKLRVVFDASCKTNTGISLNDKLKIGPIIQDGLYSILVRFRKHNYVLGADVAKMYRMVWIERPQRDLQRIVWRSTPQDELKHFRLNTVTYGTASASFLAIRSLHQAAKCFERKYPSSSQSICQDFYVDDFLSGSETREGAQKLKEEVSDILSHSGFILRKSISNDRSLLDKTDQKMENVEHYITEGTQTKTLGVLWQVDQDVLKYVVTLETSIKPTKRNILSIISKIFDPLGLIGPIIVRAKIILQRIWTEKLDWDDTVSPELQAVWNKLYQELPMLQDLSIPRHALIFQAIQIELHGFCDASELAYGACIYVRSTNSEGKVITRLLCAKSKVAPLKVISLPRLELCGAVLLSKLMSKTEEALHTRIEKSTYWTDSIIVLSWLSSEPALLKTFVGNRVSEIQQSTSKYRWLHVSSKDNPADIISRGYSPTKLMESKLWWQGPTWLKEQSNTWPLSSVELVEPPEKRPTKAQALVAFLEQNWFTLFSSLLKLQRVLAYCFRFMKNCRDPNNRIKGILTAQEMENAFEFLIKQAQLQDFSSEIECLQNDKTIPKISKLVSLNPFLDHNGILRLGGRISKSHAEYDKKFPILLSGNHILTELIIRQEHIRNLHMGTQALLANIRSRFWPLSGRNAVKRVLRKTGSRGISFHPDLPISVDFGSLALSQLTFEELSTIVTQVEACMNSRPICPLSDDPSDLNPLTPGHFLIGGPLVALPQSDYKDIPVSRLSRFQHLSKITQHFWHRWSAEYLPNLNPRSKWWQDNSQLLKENTMVLLKDESLPPLKWSLGRIVELHPGQDGVVRVVTVRTSSSTTKRAINKLAVLPIDK